MHVLHGTWVPELEQGIIWGEDTSIAPRTVKGGSKRGRAGKAATQHPFMLSQEHLLRYLDRYSPDSVPDGVEVDILLPGVAKSVQASPEASAAGIPALDGTLELLSWKIKTVTLIPVDFLDFLIALPIGDEPHPGMELGGDLRFWQQATLLAMSCLIEQRYIPALEQQGSRYVAFWRPQPDPELVDQFAERMPMLCRAVATSADDAPQPRSLLDNFLRSTVDAFVSEQYTPTRKTTSPWLMALGQGATNALTGSTRAHVILYEAWQQWQQGGETALVAGTFRVCFRLEEPIEREDDGDEDEEMVKPERRKKAEEPRWILRYMLQASDDPSLLVDAAAVWAAKGRTLTYLTRRFDDPQEKLLTALGTASRLFPPIDRSLREASPVGVLLTPDEAYQFLAEGVALLEQARFGVLVPNWWAQRTSQLKAKVQIKSKAETPSGLLGKDLLAQYQWQLSLGGQTLSRQDFEQLVALKQPLVRFRGAWVALDPAQVESALKFLDRQPADGEIGLLDALKLATPEVGAASSTVPGTDKTASDLEIEEVEIQGVLADLLEQLRHPEQTEAPAIPEGLNATLRPYQQRGFGWLAQMHRLGLGACLADDMGLGKAQPLDAKVLTPRGWKPMGAICVGDEIINSQGSTSCVVGVYPQGDLDIYKVVFSDGTFTECSDDHLWCVNTPTRKMRGNPPMILPLCEIRGRLKDAAGNCRFYLPMVQPVDFVEQALPIHPYLLGVLIGDGGLSIESRVRFTTADDDILTRLRRVLPDGLNIRKANGHQYDYVIVGKPGKDNPVLTALREFNLMDCKSADKFIPDWYRYASLLNRIELLQGLLDTDGSVSKDNVIEFTSVSERLARQVQELVESLGGIARINSRIPHFVHKGEKRDGQRSYRLIIALPALIQPFALNRKAEKYHPRPKYPPSRAIVDVVYVGKKPAQCIAVDAPDHLYVTDHFVVTHNTLQTITFWLHEHESLGVTQPSLLVAPTSVVGNWRHELTRFAPSLRVHTHQGAARQRGEDFAKAIEGANVVLTSYSLLSRDLDTLKGIPWFSVTLDEAQNIKNPQTKQAQAARAIPSDHRLALTGTPVENRLSELWSILQFLNPGYLGSREGFRTTFALPIERYADKNASAALKKLTSPFILRRVKTDPNVISDLPDKFENKIYCSLTPEQATLYEAVVREEMEEVENADSAMARRGSVLRMLTRLKQICNHPAHFLKEGEALGVEALQGRSGKLSRLTEMLEEVYSADDHALVFTQYAEMGKHLQAYLSEMFDDAIPFLYGDTPAAKREEMVRQFQAPSGPHVFILSLKAGGTGLNLTHANNVFHFDRWYNPAVENQATDRAFRIGQTRNVQVHKFICLGTLEERIDDLIEHKRGLADSIVGEGEGWISEMSTDDLRDLVALRREMVQEAE